MNDQILKDIQRRLKALEQTAVRYRAGEVTGVAPLDVALGGSSVSYEDVQAVGPITDGAQVATLLWANDMLVLGNLNGGIRFGTATVTWPGSNVISNFSASITHGLGRQPAGALITPQSQASTGPTFAWRETLDTTSLTFRASTGPSGFQPTNGTSQTYFWLVTD